MPETTDHRRILLSLTGVFLLSLFVAILLGATVGIRYSNPLPPKK